jgi:hypothetical protein
MLKPIQEAMRKLKEERQLGDIKTAVAERTPTKRKQNKSTSKYALKGYMNYDASDSEQLEQDS